MAKKLSWTEIVAAVGGAMLAISLFLPWYEAVSRLAVVDGQEGVGEYAAWDVHSIQRWLWLAAAAAPFILTYIVLRGHQLSWARGEMTAVVSLIALVLVLYAGIVDRPGEPSGQIDLRWGWFLAVAGTILMAGGSALRASETERRRKPPGVL
jgi:hypothetical protein